MKPGESLHCLVDLSGSDGWYRLLSENGIPKLRRRAKDHLKFKGRGHEVIHSATLTMDDTAY